jgi:tRNA (cmo5U34)-methyltransferase
MNQSRKVRPSLSYCRFAYVEKEDTPRPLLFQLDLLRQVGFGQVEVLHKRVCFAAFGAVKG